MPRIRTIKPEFFRSRSLAKCPRDARLTFAGLWTEADDFGRGVADSRLLKGALWALDDDITHVQVSSHLRVLAATNHIRLYEADGETYYEIVNWEDHQSAAYRRGKAQYPEPETYLDDLSHLNVKESESRTEEHAGTRNEERGTRNTLGADAPSKNGRQRDMLFETIAEVCHLDISELTKNERGKLNVARKQLDEVGADPPEVRRRAAVWRGKFPDAELTPTALANNWGQLRAQREKPGRVRGAQL